MRLTGCVSCLILIVSFGVSNAQNIITIHPENLKGTEINYISGNQNVNTISVSINEFTLNQVKTPGGDAFIIGAEEATPILEKGMPDLPKLTTSLVIPDMAAMEVRVISSQFIDYPFIDIAPSKGNIYRDTDPSTVAFEYGKAYETDQFFPSKLAYLREPYILRDFRGQTVVINPFAYNPVTRILRVYHNIQLEIVRNGFSYINSLVREETPTRFNTEYKRIYNHHFLNADNGGKYPVLEEQGNMLIICYGSFMTAMQDFVDWKRTIGIAVEMVDVATIGANSTSIKNYVANYYATNGLTYLLLVGDHAQVPTVTAGDVGGPSDHAYGYVAGSDHYPDIFVGRFSAETVAQVTTQVQRTIEYEQNPDISTDWFSKGFGIGSSEGPGDDGEYDYQHMRNIRTDLVGYTFTSIGELYDGSQGGEDLAGNPNSTSVATEVNAGRAIINYIGHGSQTSWVTTGFSNTGVNALTNNHKWPFIWSVACVNGDFTSSTCFAETWLRATNASGPTGAVATLMSTINQSWNPPMEGQDEMNDILVESYSSNIKRTFGGLSMNGCMKMNDTYGTDGEDMTDTWLIFGDPSVVLRTAFPADIAVTHEPVAFIGSSQFTVNCSVDGAIACLTQNGQILGTAIVNGGSATISFPVLNNAGTMKLAVTAFNHLPYIVDIDILPLDGPYIVYDSHLINDASSNNNGQPDYTEAISVSLSLRNVGTDDASGISVTLSSNDSYISINDANESYPLIEAGQTVSITDGFALNIADNVPDQHQAVFTISATDGIETWNTGFNMIINAPHLATGTIIIEDNCPSCNNDGILDPGETANLIVTCLNSGHSIVTDVQGALALPDGSNPYLTLNTSSFSIGNIASGSQASAIYSVTADALTPLGTAVSLLFTFTGGLAGQYSAQLTSQLVIGLIPEFNLTNGSVTTCTGVFYDTGGSSGTYQNNENFSETFYPATAGAMVRFTFTSFDLESGYDYLRIYDGINTSAPLIGTYSGVTGPGTVTATNSSGALTFNFTSDVSVTNSGWSAAINCYSSMEPPVAAFSGSETSIPVNGIVTFTDQTLNAPTSWQWSFSPNTVIFANGTNATSQNPQVQFTSLGNYTVTLTTNNAYGSDTEIKTNYINVVQFEYCIPAYTTGTGSGDYISLVQLGSINNATGASVSPYYTYFSTLSTDLNPGSGYSITLSPGTYSTGNNISVWIDYNQNGFFETTEKLGNVNIGPMPATGSIAFTVPSDAQPGTTRMRVREVWNNSTFDACSSYGYGETEDYNVYILSNDKTLNLTVYLEGLYAGNGIMNQVSDETGSHFSAGIADQITVELHNQSDYNIIECSISEINLFTNGTATVIVPGEFSNSFYLTIKHRNSIEITTASPVNFSGSVINYSFDQPSGVFGGKLLSMGDGHFGIYSGDINQDGQINNSDITIVANDAELFLTGYIISDVNGDGITDTADLTIIDNNSSGFVGSALP